MDVHFLAIKTWNWWMTFPQNNVQQNWKSKSCDFGRLPNSLLHAYLKIWKRNASPLAKKNTKKKLSKMSKAHISHDSSVKRIFRICWDFTPKKMGEKNHVLVMGIPWDKGCQPSKAKSQIDSYSYSKIYQNSQNLSKKKSSATTVCCFLISMISMGWNYSLTNQNMICITKSQGANIHVFHPLHLGTSALGNFCYHGTNVSISGESRNLQVFSAIMLHAAAPGLARGWKRTRGVWSKLAFWCGFNV